MKMLKTVTGIIPLTLLLGCSNPADKVPGAAVGSATNAPADSAKADAGDRYFAFGPSLASIEFTGSKVTGRHQGGFRNFAGEFKVANGRLADSGNKIVIDTSSLWADNDRVAGHLKGPDFFNVGLFPAATFLSTSIEPKETNSLVTGNLTLHGVTKQISFPAKVQTAEDGVTVSAQLFINRFDFNIRYPGKANDLIRKEVVLRLNVKSAPGRADFAALETAAPAALTPATARPPGAPRP